MLATDYNTLQVQDELRIHGTGVPAGEGETKKSGAGGSVGRPWPPSVARTQAMEHQAGGMAGSNPSMEGRKHGVVQ